MACAAMRTPVRRPRFFANASDVKIAAAAPQVGGQATRRVMTPGQTTLSLITSSAVTSLRKMASGLFLACRLAFARTLAKVFKFRAVLFHVAQSGSAEITQRQGN